MRIACVGGGPAGLFLATLLARGSRHSVSVFDRDPPDASYGFGVVMSRMSSARLRAVAPDVIDEISSLGVRWDGVEVQAWGDVARSQGHAFSAVGRNEMLRVLRKHARDAGVRIFQPWRVAGLGGVRGYDLVIAADGAGSGVRQELADHFKPSVRYGSSRYVWCGATRPFDCMTFLFAQGPHGPIGAHVYPYSRTASTFLIEAPEQVWRSAGLLDDATRPPGWTDQRLLDYCGQMFGDALGGAQLVGNGSRLLRFPEVRNARWSAPGVVLMGDAAHTAHFSVGSGTSMAMEDAAELASSLCRLSRVPDALAAYEAARRPVTASVQAAAWASSQYWERLEREVGRDASQIMLRLLTRTGQSDMELLLKVDPGLQAAMDAGRRALPAVPTPAVAFGSAGRGTREPRCAVLLRPSEIDALDGAPARTPDWAALALVVDGADASAEAVSRTAARLTQLRRCSAGAPAGVLYYAHGSEVPGVNFNAMAASMTALAQQAPLDFVAVGCRDGAQATQATQMTLCDYVRAELRVPAVYACAPGRLSYGRTHVAAARADHVWLLQAGP